MICAVCLDWLSDAVETPCGHAFCGGCVLSLLQHRRTQHAAAAGRKGAACPSCRASLRGTRPAQSLRRAVRFAQAQDAADAEVLAATDSQSKASLAQRDAVLRRLLELETRRQGPPSYAYASARGRAAYLDPRYWAMAFAAITIALNVHLMQSATAKPGASAAWTAASNGFSAFSHAVGLAAAIRLDGQLAHGYVWYVGADMVFAVGPTLWKLLAWFWTRGSTRGELLVAVLTLVLNACYNGLCVVIAWSYYRGFDLVAEVPAPVGRPHAD